MRCRNHPDIAAYIVCQKMSTGYCMECFHGGSSCADPTGYCKFRPQCIIWENFRERERKVRNEKDREAVLQ